MTRRTMRTPHALLSATRRVFTAERGMLCKYGLGYLQQFYETVVSKRSVTDKYLLRVYRRQ
jgi:hypothetical protein